MEILDILSREQDRLESEVYLYEEKGHWYAFEHSAELISDLLKGIVTIKCFIHDTFLVVNFVEIDLSLLDKLSITSCSDTQLVIACPKEAC